MSAILVIEPGLQSTLQDRGRVGYQRLGVPVSGALDPVSLRIANRLVGNAPSTVAIEMALMGPMLEVVGASVRVALVGTAATLDVLAPEPRKVPPLQSVRLAAGTRFRIGGFGDSAVAYLAIEGGLDIEPVMGSLSTHWRAQVGPMGGRKLAAGDRLPLRLADAPERPEQRLASLGQPRPARFRVVLGPQDDLFSPAHIETLLGSTYRVSREADRWGMRLEGPALAHSISMVSDAIAPGAIQVPAGGQPIVLMADRATTGGYPKIATVISADLPALGRLTAGAPVAFAAVSVAEAEAARRALEQSLVALESHVETVRDGGGVDLERLYEANLVSGVIAAEPPEPQA